MRGSWQQLAAVFLIGGLAGGLVGARCQKAAYHRFWQHGPNSERILKKFTRELDLDPKQQEAVKGVLDGNRAKVMVLHKEMAAKLGEIRSSMRVEVSKLLNDAQRKKFEAMAARWDARHKQVWTGKEAP